MALATKSKKKSKMQRGLAATLAALFCLWLSFLGYIAWAMRQPPDVFGHVMARLPMPAFFLLPFETMWTPARKGTLNPGSAAPDFTVTKLDGHVPVRLASLWEERPVVLVFGSYT
jgi:hypothetical protein